MTSHLCSIRVILQIEFSNNQTFPHLLGNYLCCTGLADISEQRRNRMYGWRTGSQTIEFSNLPGVAAHLEEQLAWRSLSGGGARLVTVCCRLEERAGNGWNNALQHCSTCNRGSGDIFMGTACGGGWALCWGLEPPCPASPILVGGGVIGDSLTAPLDLGPN